MEANIGAFAMPGSTAGTTAPAFLGGSNLAISGQERAPGPRPRPGEDHGVDRLPGAVRRQPARSRRSSRCSAASPAARPPSPRPRPPRTAGSSRRARTGPAVEAANILPDMLVADRPGGADRRRPPSAPTRRSRRSSTADAARRKDEGSVEWLVRHGPPADRHRTARRRRVIGRCPTSCCCRPSRAARLMLGYPLVRLVDAVAAGVRAEAAVRRTGADGSASTTSARSSTES